MKTCTKCMLTKDETEYFVRDKSTGRLHAQCKGCYKSHRQSYQANHYLAYRDTYLVRAKLRHHRVRSEYRANMLQYLSDKQCCICGENDVRVLEFDHIDPKAKSFSISQAVKLGRSWSEVIEELKKCRVLCANCHKRHTAEQQGWYKAQ